MLKNGSKKILIADNDEVILIALEHTLETEGYDTAVALSAEEIFWMLSRANFDLVVLDDYLSDKDSFEILARFQQAEIRPAVVVTHHRYPAQEEQERLRSLGASAFVSKRAHADLTHIIRFLLQPQKGCRGDSSRAS
jgi:DNA-binding response OmpR family regulator